MIHFEDKSVTLWHGDCLDVLRGLPDASVDSVCTDPPYGLANTDPAHVAETITRWVNGERDYLPGGKGFMGKAWDAFVPPVAVWDDCLRVLKPGGHVLAFAGTRTVDLMTLGLRLAGFEIRDSLAWLYGSGFPKSLDVSKAIDKAAPRVGMPAGFAAHYAERRKAKGLTHREVCEAGRFYAEHNKGGASVNWEKGYNVPTPAQWAILSDLLDIPHDMWAPLIDRMEAERQITGQHLAAVTTGDAGLTVRGEGKERRDTPATPDAERWQGWGTALKPAFEPVVVARKPLIGTVASNVLAHGTGALNVDGCRIEGEPWKTKAAETGIRSIMVHDGADGAASRADIMFREKQERSGNAAGRWPANVILDESQAAALDEMSGPTLGGPGGLRERPASTDLGGMNDDGWKPKSVLQPSYSDTVGASRFMYVAKADASERPRVGGVAHPTVKPLALMRWLVRLVTPPGGTVLEPFAGSGTTVEACIVEGFRCIAIEREADYLPLIEARISRRRDPVRAIELAGEDMGLFDLDGWGA